MARWRNLCCLLLFGAIALAALPGAAPARAPVDTGEFTARSLVRLALFDYRIAPERTPADAELLHILFGISENLAPEDEAIVRLRLDAAFAMGDADAVIQQTRRILLLDPDDEVSQLRFVSHLISKRQTIEQRIAAYDKLVGEQGRQQGLSAAIRSRLATDAALLKREQGDLEGFVEMLDHATTLDSTNKEAASLALNFYAENVDDPIGRLDLLSNLLYADPVDPNIHDAIMRELARAGAFAPAMRFYKNQASISAAAGRSPDEALATTGLVLEWQLHGPLRVVEGLNHSLAVQREEAQEYLRMMIRGRQPTTGVPEPDDIRLPAFQDAVRVVAAHAAGDAATVDAAMADIARTASVQMQSLRDPEVVGRELTQEEITAFSLRILDHVTTMRLWTGRQLDLVAKDLESFDGGRAEEQEGGETKPEGATITIYRGWLALRQGDPYKAIELLRGVPGGYAFVDLGIALARYEVGERQEALDELARLARSYPLTSIGAYARTKYETYAEEDLRLSNHVSRMTEWARGVPFWLDRMAVEPQRFISFEIEPVRTAIDALGRSGLRVRIKNSSTIPLAFGPGRPISSRLMLVPRTDIGIENIAGGFEPEVVDVQRRFRLLPREMFETVIWPDPGETGYFTELAAPMTSRTRWRGVLGFTVTQEGVYQTGPMGLTDEANASILRLPLPECDHSIEELARRIRDDEESVLPKLVAALRSRVQELASAGLEPAQAQRAAQSIAPAIQAAADRYQTCSPRTRLMMAVLLQSKRFFEPMAPMDEAVRADEDENVRIVALFTRVLDLTDPLLAEALDSEEARVARTAALINNRLEAQRPSISFLRPAGRGQQAPQGR